MPKTSSGPKRKPNDRPQPYQHQGSQLQPEWWGTQNELGFSLVFLQVCRVLLYQIYLALRTTVPCNHINIARVSTENFSFPKFSNKSTWRAIWWSWVRVPPGVSYFPSEISIVPRTALQQSKMGVVAQRGWQSLYKHHVSLTPIPHRIKYTSLLWEITPCTLNLSPGRPEYMCSGVKMTGWTIGDFTGIGSAYRPDPTIGSGLTPDWLVGWLVIEVEYLYSAYCDG